MAGPEGPEWARQGIWRICRFGSLVSFQAAHTPGIKIRYVKF
ncbi:hypothetical protein HMPREF6745_2921 [Prevotella sp. oral taxon 472 str. F0295]|nr:hypothetical protein HMPREF6745_2921 [Prevotella sp. oral taxon 472 str. F0295]